MNEKCETPNCPHEARMALVTSRPSRLVLKTTVYYDNRTAPPRATRYCRRHGLVTVDQSIRAIVAADTYA